MELTPQQLLRLDQEGLIPGPDESAAAFAQRASYCLALKENLQREMGDGFPFAEEPQGGEEVLGEAHAITANAYGIRPHWIPLFFSDHQLVPWQGGCAWIFQIAEDSPRGALLQLRSGFRNRSTYLGLYNRDELLAHEMAHVGRTAFDEPHFEEFLAYRSSKSPFRRWFGPIFKSYWESMLFVILLTVIFVLDLSLISMGRYELYQAIYWTKLIPLTLIVAGIARLAYRHRQLNACGRKLQATLGDRKKGEAVMYRLTDGEICTFGKMEPQAIKQYLQENSTASLRLQVILAAYFR